MSQELRTKHGRTLVAYIRGAMFSLLADPADRVLAERCMVEIEKQVRLTEEEAMTLPIRQEDRVAVLTR